MASIQDIVVAASINLTSALMFLLAFAFLRLQPFNDRVYFPKWYFKGTRTSPKSKGLLANKFINLDIKTYLKFWKWMPDALKMSEAELIEHAGLDSAVYIRIYLLGLKIFIPIAVVSSILLIPINLTSRSLVDIKDLTYSNIDKLSISNVRPGSFRFSAHILMAYIVTYWTCKVLYNEYKIVAKKRLKFLASEHRRPDQFTVLVRNVPRHPDESVSEHVGHFFSVTHPDYYLTHQVVYDAKLLSRLVQRKETLQGWVNYYQKRLERYPKKRPITKTGCWGFCGESVDAIEYFTEKLKQVTEEEAAERHRLMSDPKAIVPAAFVSFSSRWGAAVCAQTQQSSNPTRWLTQWAPEPRDIYWDNLAIPFLQLSIKKLFIAVATFFLVFFFMIPIAFVQSMASIDGIEKTFPFVRPLIEMDTVKSIVQGFLPGIALKIFLALLPTILMTMSKMEGHIAFSSLDRTSAGKYYVYVLVNVFFGSVITGAAFQQLHKFLTQPPREIPRTIGVAIPMKATFFITYIMVDGWAGIAAEILRLVPLIVFHVKNTFLVKTDAERERAMDAGNLDFPTLEPQIQLYFLLGLVYSTVTPIILPFIIIFFAFSYLVFRHQIINVYDQKYESGARYWPDVHRRVIIALVISQLLLMGLLSVKKAYKSTPLLLLLPIITFGFHRVCKRRFESAFVKFPLEDSDAMVKDMREKASEAMLNLKDYLQDAYVHPVFQGMEMNKPTSSIDEESNPTITTKHKRRKSSKGSDNEILSTIGETVLEEIATYLSP